MFPSSPLSHCSQCHHGNVPPSPRQQRLVCWGRDIGWWPSGKRDGARGWGFRSGHQHWSVDGAAWSSFPLPASFRSWQTGRSPHYKEGTPYYLERIPCYSKGTPCIQRGHHLIKKGISCYSEGAYCSGRTLIQRTPSYSEDTILFRGVTLFWWHTMLDGTPNYLEGICYSEGTPWYLEETDCCLVRTQCYSEQHQVIQRGHHDIQHGHQINQRGTTLFRYNIMLFRGNTKLFRGNILLFSEDTTDVKERKEEKTFLKSWGRKWQKEKTQWKKKKKGDGWPV